MEPYYETKLGKLYHGDCLEVLPELEPVDLVLTDPPYGIADKWDKPQIGKNGASRLWVGDNEWDQKINQAAVSFCLKIAKKIIIWGGNYYQLPPSRGYLIWDKIQKFSNADSEFAWCSWDQTPRTFRSSRAQLATEGKIHPTQKPKALFVWCLNFCPKANIVLDPFLGSGTTAVACEELGRRWIGIEISEKYCEIAAKRIEKENQQMRLFQ